MAVTTSMADTFKAELMQGAHCFNAPVTIASTAGVSGSTSLTLANVTGVAVGMAVTGTGLAGSNVAAINSATVVTVAPALSATAAGSYTFTGDTFKMALVVATPAGTYNNTTSLYSQITADEVANGGGYATGGAVLTANITPALNGATAQAVTSWSNGGPSWTSATFSTSGCMIYNSTDRMSGITGRACGVFSFGGTQTVSSGTFSVVLPSNVSNSAILRVA